MESGNTIVRIVMGAHGVPMGNPKRSVESVVGAEFVCMGCKSRNLV